MSNKTAAITGGLGDTIYAIPVLRELGVKTVYVKDIALDEGMSTYKQLKKILNYQGFDALPTKGEYPLYEFDPEIHIDYNLDMARTQKWRGSNHIIISYMKQFNCFIQSWRQPWLHTILNNPYFSNIKPENYSLQAGKYDVVAVTPRWREHSKVNWSKVLKDKKQMIFLGWYSDFEAFLKQFPDLRGRINLMYTPTLANSMYWVENARHVYCNQNVVLTLAQGLGKHYSLEKKPFRNNTVLGTHNEIIL